MDNRLEDLDASLQDFETPFSNPNSYHFQPSVTKNQNSHPASSVVTQTQAQPLRRSEAASIEMGSLSEAEDSETSSVAGYSPAAWRRLGNGDKSPGFWKRDSLGGSRADSPLNHRGNQDIGYDEDDDPGLSDDDLHRAVRTKLPRGSQSPDKGMTPAPEGPEEETIKFNKLGGLKGSEETDTSPSDNYFRFAVRAEVVHRTEPIEQLIRFLRPVTATWSSMCLSVFVGILSIAVIKNLLQTPSQRPAGDIVKVAGIARSFEPLIHYSESAVLQVKDLQATSIAVWDLSESVRTSKMQDAAVIVSGLNELSESMKTLAIQTTRFFASVDSDIDDILNVMSWSKLHLQRLKSSQSLTPLSSAYDNMHNLLSTAHILEDTSGNPTAIGTVTTWVFGLSNPQREQRMIQHVFNDFLQVLENSITNELSHSTALFALFEQVDRHFLTVANSVVREEGIQDQMHSDLLSSMWTRMLGGKAAELRKFETNRSLLRDVRRKTVLNKELLMQHNGKLLSLQTALEALRTKLVSPLVRGVNSSTLTLEDQIQGLSDVSQYLGRTREEQKDKVKESLLSVGSRSKFMIEPGRGIVGEMNSETRP